MEIWQTTAHSCIRECRAVFSKLRRHSQEIMAHLLLIAAAPALRVAPLAPASSLRLPSPTMAMADKDAASDYLQGGGHPSGTPEARLMGGVVVPPVADKPSPAAAPTQGSAGIRSEACQMDGGRPTGSEMRLTGGVVVPPLGDSSPAAPPTEEESVGVPTVPVITSKDKDAASAYLKGGGNPSGTETRVMGIDIDAVAGRAAGETSAALPKPLKGGAAGAKKKDTGKTKSK